MCSVFFFFSFFFWEEAKCVVDFSQSIKNIKGVDKSKSIHDIIFYTCPYLFFYTVESPHYVKLLRNLYIQYSCSLKDSCSSCTTVSCLISPRSLTLA